MKKTKVVMLFGQAELAAWRLAKQEGRECCGCPACPCGCNGFSGR